MQTPYWQVDAFTDRLFAGNPAGVCLLEDWLDDSEMQAIASENNLSETAFVVRTEAGPESEPREGRRAAGAGTRFGLRWFTPTTEVDLCGHATLAAGLVVLRYMEGSRDRVTFHTKSGPLEVWSEDELLSMRFPGLPPEPDPAGEPVGEALGLRPAEVLVAKDHLAVYERAEEVASLRPDMDRVAALGARGVIATAPAAPAVGGEEADFVSRFFAPGVGVPEDPVTGSAHCTLAPYWAGRLGRDRLVGRQISPRGGTVICEVEGDRVVLSGGAVLYLEGTIRLPGVGPREEG